MPQQRKYNKLADKHIVIFGGSAGIGRAVAEASIESGARVTISSSSSTRINTTIKEIQSLYPEAHISGHACDLSKSGVEQDIEGVFKQIGHVDHIVFTAGDSLASMPLEDVTYDKIIAAGQVRLFAPLLVAKVGKKYLTSSPESSIVLTTGSVAEHPMPNWSVVASYAAALHGLTRNLALDMKPIRVNLVSPGAVETGLWDGMPKDQKAQMVEGIKAKVPTGRMGQPEDVAEAYLWLMKDANVTGRIAATDSGSLLV